MLLAAAFIVYVSLRTAPLELSASLREGDYPDGYKVGDIVWDKSFSDIRVDIEDMSQEAYSNVDILIRTDISIAKVWIKQNFSNCTAKPFVAATLGSMMIKAPNESHVVTVPNSEDPASILMTPVFKVHCEKIFPKERIELVIAALVFGGQRVKPKWVSGSITYEGLLQSRTAPPFAKCFDVPCDNIWSPLNMAGRTAIVLSAAPPMSK